MVRPQASPPPSCTSANGNGLQGEPPSPPHPFPTDYWSDTAAQASVRFGEGLIITNICILTGQFTPFTSHSHTHTHTLHHIQSMCSHNTTHIHTHTHCKPCLTSVQTHMHPCCPFVQMISDVAGKDLPRIVLVIMFIRFCACVMTNMIALKTSLAVVCAPRLITLGLMKWEIKVHLATRSYLLIHVVQKLMSNAFAIICAGKLKSISTMTLQIYSEQYNNISSQHFTSRLIVKTCENTEYINSRGEVQLLMISEADGPGKIREATF